MSEPASCNRGMAVAGVVPDAASPELELAASPAMLWPRPTWPAGAAGRLDIDRTSQPRSIAGCSANTSASPPGRPSWSSRISRSPSSGSWPETTGTPPPSLLLCHLYHVPNTDETAPYIAEVTGNDPFYIERDDGTDLIGE